MNCLGCAEANATYIKQNINDNKACITRRRPADLVFIIFAEFIERFVISLVSETLALRAVAATLPEGAVAAIAVAAEAPALSAVKTAVTAETLAFSAVKIIIAAITSLAFSAIKAAVAAAVVLAVKSVVPAAELPVLAGILAFAKVAVARQFAFLGVLSQARLEVALLLKALGRPSAGARVRSLCRRPRHAWH